MRRRGQISGLLDIKSIHSAGLRSIPKVQRSSYLELYMLKTEKSRLEQEIFALDKRNQTLQRQLESIDRRIEKLQKEAYEEQKIKTHKRGFIKPLKTIRVNY
jgi:peptidoglycan hydrolase CwlO-like protein